MAHRSINRSVIQEIGSSSQDPFVFSEASDWLASLCFGTEEDIERTGAYVAIFRAMDGEYVGDPSIPAQLGPDQIEDWLIGTGVRAGLIARQAQDRWDEARRQNG